MKNLTKKHLKSMSADDILNELNDLCHKSNKSIDKKKKILVKELVERYPNVPQIAGKY